MASWPSVPPPSLSAQTLVTSLLGARAPAIDVLCPRSQESERERSEREVRELIRDETPTGVGRREGGRGGNQRGDKGNSGGEEERDGEGGGREKGRGGGGERGMDGKGRREKRERGERSERRGKEDASGREEMEKRY